MVNDLNELRYLNILDGILWSWPLQWSISFFVLLLSFFTSQKGESYWLCLVNSQVEIPEFASLEFDKNCYFLIGLERMSSECLDNFEIAKVIVLRSNEFNFFLLLLFLLLLFFRLGLFFIEIVTLILLFLLLNYLNFHLFFQFYVLFLAFGQFRKILGDGFLRNDANLFIFYMDHVSNDCLLKSNENSDSGYFWEYSLLDIGDWHPN